MKPFTAVRSRVALLTADNVDTDQIVPARFLKTTSRESLAGRLFHDWRYDAEGRSIPGFVLNRPGAPECRILVTGANFGCGSSREHAAWALLDFGFRAIVARSFGDIFRQNALRNRLLPVELSGPDHLHIVEAVTANPEEEVTIDLERQVVVLSGGGSCSFTTDSFARTCLLEGIDEIDYVLRHQTSIERFERSASRGALC